MRRLFIVLLAAVGLIAATVVPALPAAGQEDDNPLTINPDVGHPGDLVAAHVDPATVDDNCMTTPEEIQEFFAIGVTQSPFVDALGEYFDNRDGFPNDPTDPESFEDAALLSFAGLLFGLAGATGDEPAEQLLASTFILTFVDVATQQPVGEPTNYNPTTGHGQIAVPDLDPGLWAIAATCVEPEFSPEAADAALVDGGACLANWADENELSLEDVLGIGLLDPEFADMVGACADALLAPFMVPQEGAGPWVQPFSIPGPGAEVDPAVEAFCGVLPELSPLGDEVTAALAGLPEDDGEMTDEEWAESEDWDAIEAELRELFATANELMAIGDETRADAVAPQWEIVTAPLRQATEALEAVDYDLSTPSGRQITGELREGATGENGDGNGESAAATEVLTQWFLDNCIPAAPPAEVPVEETPREAPPAPVATAQPTFTG